MTYPVYLIYIIEFSKIHAIWIKSPKSNKWISMAYPTTFDYILRQNKIELNRISERNLNGAKLIMKKYKICFSSDWDMVIFLNDIYKERVKVQSPIKNVTTIIRKALRG